MLWTEKYRPKTFKDILGNKKEIQKIELWVKDWKENKIKKPLLLMGPPGTGKTTIAHIIGNEFNEFMELNASDKRNYDILINTIGETAQTHSLFQENKKLIILDEVDGISGNDDRGGSRAINQIIKKSKQPMVMTANDPYSKRLTTIKTKCIPINIKKVHTNSIGAMLKRICSKEKIKIDPNVAKQLAKQSNGDMRSALNNLQMISEGKTEITMDDLKIISTKDSRNNRFDAVKTVLKSKTVPHIKDAIYTDEDPTLIMEMIAENIPREYEHPNEIKKAYQNIAQADLYFGRARNSRNYTYWRYASDFMGVGVALSKKETYKKFTPIQGSGAFAMMAKNRGKRNLRDSILDKMTEQMHISHQIGVSMFPYLEIIFQNDEMAYDIASYLDLTDDEIKRFRSRKIPAKVIKAKEKEKIAKRKPQTTTKTTKTTKKPTKKEETSKKEKVQEEKKDSSQTSLFNF